MEQCVTYNYFLEKMTCCKCYNNFTCFLNDFLEKIACYKGNIGKRGFRSCFLGKIAYCKGDIETLFLLEEYVLACGKS